VAEQRRRTGHEKTDLALDSVRSIKRHWHTIDAIKLRRDRAVFEGTYKGTPAILKAHFGDKAPALVEGQIKALQSRETLCEDPPLVARLLAHNVTHGLQMIEKIDGDDLGKRFSDLSFTALDACTMSAQWLDRTPRAEKDNAPVATFFWRKFLNAPLPKHLSTGDRLTYRALADFCRPLLGDMDVNVTRSCGHGDFQPCNLIEGPHGLIAVDTREARPLPMVRETAFFFSRLNSHRPLPSVGSEAWKDLCRPFAAQVTSAEFSRLFPFFLGIELLRSLKTSQQWSPSTADPLACTLDEARARRQTLTHVDLQNFPRR